MHYGVNLSIYLLNTDFLDFEFEREFKVMDEDNNTIVLENVRKEC